MTCYVCDPPPGKKLAANCKKGKTNRKFRRNEVRELLTLLAEDEINRHITGTTKNRPLLYMLYVTLNTNAVVLSITNLLFPEFQNAS